MTKLGVLSSRNAAIAGPYLSGKTTLLESLQHVTNAITRKGSTKDGTSLGDNSPEARSRQMSVEINVASTDYEDIHFTFLDCPGSVEFAQETYNALMGVGAAIVVCEPDPDRILTLAPLFKFLDDWEIPHMVFINKMDRVCTDEDRCLTSFSQLLDALKSVSSRPIVPHQYPIASGDNIIGYIDLVSEQAYHYHADAPADPVPLPESLKAAETQARTEMLETLADFDDHLLEELLEEIEPSQEEIVKDLKMELGADLIVPVFIGVAEKGYGVRPLLDALKREAPSPDITSQRRGLDPESDVPVAQVLKTFYTPQGGKQSLVRVWQGELSEGLVLNGVRPGGIYRLFGAQQKSTTKAGLGEIVALARMDGVHTGDTLSVSRDVVQLPQAGRLQPVYAMAIAPQHRKDEVKLTPALNKLLEEDPSLHWEQHGDTHEIILWGQGEIHLQVSLERLQRKYNLPMATHLPRVAYKETIRKPVAKIHGRYKHQSGGHGQFGDVYLDIRPLQRGEGFSFDETIVGGVVPKQYIPGVETGVREYLGRGPLGFPVVDVGVTLTNGSYHGVDSSEQAFKQAARLAMTSGMSQGKPILLEPIAMVTVSAPVEFTSKVLQLLTGRRGQILGYEPLESWKGWDKISAYLPQAEMHGFIIELRSLTLGVGFFDWHYDRLHEVPDKIADRILATTAD
ncbi:elongation factor G [Roseofilum casamattae]|uniref:Elongation factor G n=1 Tax=Roseofilum casamattae BLCC-M143 TaxID=3022442 RepID=A0ABT7BX15_9CYAN|nr:elongation factor G [Roseofilum casamattae]MDJ1183620.1 elongation factor G [Roseofilum casamattae BLCC-M143]